MIENKSIDVLTQGLLRQLESKFYGKDTLNNYRRILKNLNIYMQQKAIFAYEVRVGDEFIKNYLGTHKVSSSFQKTINTVIRRLNDYNEGKPYVLQYANTQIRLQKHYQVFLESYLLFCKENGNRASTLKSKKRFCEDFLISLTDLGCNDISKINSAKIANACLRFNNKDAWAVIRMFLKYLQEKNIIEHDYSTLIPNYSRPTLIPVTYTEDEILRFENAIDLTCKIGIRDYAMLLLATRLGMRSGDIVRLTFSDINFESNSIYIIQEKNMQPLELPLLPEIKNALINYITNARPLINTETRIFLRQNAPYQGITTATIRFATTKYFKKAGIDISSKKHGTHAFRSSLASSMINGNVSYDIVRKVLGHTDQNAIKNYAKVDIERLREYAIAVPKPSGLFELFLKGDLRLNGI